MVNCAWLIFMDTICTIYSGQCAWWPALQELFNCSTNISMDQQRYLTFITPTASDDEATPYGKLCVLASYV